MSELLLVGRIARAHGNKGQVIVNPETDFPVDRFAEGNLLVIEQAGRSESRRIRSARFHSGRPVIALEGVDSMDAAAGLAGAELKVPASDVPPLPGGTFYHHDLVGCEVRTTTGQVIGRVSAVEGPMERSRLVIAGARGEVMVPMVEEFCVSVDLAARVILIDPPEGLLEL